MVPRPLLLSKSKPLTSLHLTSVLREISQGLGLEPEVLHQKEALGWILSLMMTLAINPK